MVVLGTVKNILTKFASSYAKLRRKKYKSKEFEGIKMLSNEIDEQSIQEVTRMICSMTNIDVPSPHNKVI